jgi:hypothetical protein
LLLQFYKLGVYVIWDIGQFLSVEIEICFCVGHCQLQLVCSSWYSKSETLVNGFHRAPTTIINIILLNSCQAFHVLGCMLYIPKSH